MAHLSRKLPVSSPVRSNLGRWRQLHFNLIIPADFLGSPREVCFTFSTKQHTRRLYPTSCTFNCWVNSKSLSINCCGSFKKELRINLLWPPDSVHVPHRVHWSGRWFINWLTDSVIDSCVYCEHCLGCCFLLCNVVFESALGSLLWTFFFFFFISCVTLFL